MSLVHGGNVYEIAAGLGCRPEDLLDYSASINPLGPPSGLLERFGSYFERLQHYPDIHNRALVDALGAHHRIDPAGIVVGNGSTELIYTLPRALGIQRVLVALPTFSEYRKAFDLNGIETRACLCGPESDFLPTVAALEKGVSEHRPQAILVTNPGSPSGALLPPEVIEWLLETCRERRICCLVDEVFADFCEDASLKARLRHEPQLLLIRSMTKFYGIPGLRLGYLLTSPELAVRVEKALPPWSVNTLAQIAGVYCLDQRQYQQKTLELVNRERDRVSRALGRLDGLRVFPGHANYLLVRLADRLPAAKVLQQELLESDRILIRDCSSFAGMGARDFRVAVRRPEQNDRLLQAITAWYEARSSV